MNKRFFLTILVFIISLPLFSESILSDYFGKTFHGNMMGKITMQEIK